MPSCYLNDAHFTAIRQHIDDGCVLFARGYALLIEDAQRLLEKDVLSIRQAGGSPYLRTDSIYVPNQDGIVNTESNQHGFELIGQVAQSCLTLAYAYRISGEKYYADKSLELIHGWCINENTRMFATGQVEDPATPGFQHGGNVGLMMHMPDLFLACYLLDDYCDWELSPHAGVRRWIKNMIDPQRHTMFFAGYEMYNNWEDARLKYLATGALALHDIELLMYVFERWKSIIPTKMSDEGALPRECERTRSMTYTIAALDMAVAVADIAKACSLDLYNYSHNGKSIKSAIDYAAHYLIHMDEWPHTMINPIEEEMNAYKHFGLWEMAYSEWQEERYLQIINTYNERPLTRGHTTLIFGRQ